MPGIYGFHAVRGFFENGGTEAYVVRVVGSDSTAPSTAASVVLNDRSATPIPTVRLTAGRRGHEDPGAWGNSLTVTIVDHPRGSSALPAQIIGARQEPFSLADKQTLQITVNGATTVTITFNESDFVDIGAALAAEVAAVINARTAALRAGITPDRRLILVSGTSGAASRLEVTGTSASGLGFSGTANSGTALATGTSLVAMQSMGGVLRRTAVQLETRGHVIAANAMATT